MDMVQKFMIEYYARNLAKRDLLTRIQQLFEEIDTNDDGLLGFDEIKEALGTMKTKKANSKTKKIFSCFKKSQKDHISFREFQLAIIDFSKMERDSIRKKMFYNLDIKKEGVIRCKLMIKHSEVKGEANLEERFKADFGKYTEGKLQVDLIR